jgi:hypothetical protein
MKVMFEIVSKKRSYAWYDHKTILHGKECTHFSQQGSNNVRDCGGN